MSSLLRSTKFVRYFTGAARTLILNSAKTAEVSSLINPKTLSAVNNIIVRDYATTKKTESLEPLLQKLDSEVRRFGRITKRDIDEVFDELKTKQNITSSQSLLVIRCCGELVPEELPEQRTLLVQKIWNVLTERGVPMDISHYNALLRVYLENEHPFSPAKFLEELERKGLQPNRVTYQRLMWRYCQEGDVEGATKVLEKMRELNMPVSEPVLNALVMGHAFHGDTDGAKAVLDTMAGAGLEPSNRTYTLLACGYAKKGDIDGVKNIIKTANEKDSLMTDRDILDIIEHLAVGGHGDKVEELFPFLQKSFGYNQDVCNLILRLLNKGQEETAKNIMKTMPQAANAEDTFYKGAFFVKQLLRVNRSTESLIKTCRELQSEGMVPNALYMATEAALQQGHTELAQELFKELKKDGFEIRQHYFWPLLARKGKEGDEEGLLQIVRNMVGHGLTPTGECLRDYIIPYLIEKDSAENVILKLQIANVPVVHAARNLIVELLDAGKIEKAAKIALTYQPRGQYNLMTRPLLNALAKTKDIDSFTNILHVISFNPTVQTEEDTSHDDAQSDDKSDSNEIGRIVQAAVKNLNLDLREKLLKAVHSKGLRISTAAAEEIEQYLGQNMTTNLSELLAQLTSSDLEVAPLESPRRPSMLRNSTQLEQLIAQLKTKEGSNVIRLQKQLIIAYIKEKNLEKLESHLAELRASDFEFNPGLLGQIYEFYCENDLIEKAVEIKNELAKKYPDFTLNRYKLVSFAYALVRAKRYDEAIQVLKDNRPAPDDETLGFAFNSKCWQMVNTLAEDKNIERVKEMTKVLIENEYMEASNVILGPSIKVHLLMDDLEGALKEFENCCNKYRSTPWKGELMKSLIMKEDAAKLQWLADMSTQIHGEVNILHDLVLAFVECGRLRQARRILETPGLQSRPRRIDDACERYVQEGKSEYLEGLLEATKELSHIDRSKIFYHLLKTYCKANETDKALGLWTLLQEEGEVPSEQFLQYLGRHLKSKNRPVPFVVPEETGQKEQVRKERRVGQNKESTNTIEAKILTKNAISLNIENLVKGGKAAQAMDVTLNSMQKGVMPKFSVIKFMLKSLAEAGQVEKIEAFGKLLNEEQKKDVTFDDKLTMAKFAKGQAAQHIDSLYEAVTKAQNDEELQDALRKFPRSIALGSIMNKPDIISKCHKIAEIAASKGQLNPVNLLWMEYLLADKHAEADALYNLWLKDAGSIVFRRLLQEAHTRNQPHLIEKLIDCLKSNQKVTPGSVGNAYSRLVSLYVSTNRTDKALATVEAALKSGLEISHFTQNCLKKLKQSLENEGKEFCYAI